jgi:peptide/nickel transport system substrate-binding protein
MARTQRRISAFVSCAILVTLFLPMAHGQGDSVGEPVRGGTLIFAIGGDPQTLNPAITTNVEALAVSCKMFNGLVWVDRDFVAQPELAESWDISEDGLTYTFHLRDDVLWHDGTPFTAADVVYTFLEVLAPFHPRTARAFENVSSVTMLDDYTVVVEFHTVYAPFLQQMTCQEGAILPKHLYEGTDPANNPRAFDNPVGTGPFVFAEWRRGDRVVMTRNDNYFREGQPYLDQMIAQVLPDPNSRVLGMLAGQVDYIQSFFLPREEVARLEADPSIQTQRDTDLPGNFIMFFNVANEPLSDPAVRQALLVGLNREQIASQAFFGLATPGESAIHRALSWASHPGVSYSERYGYDPERANQMLDELGLVRGANNTRFSMRLLYNPAQAGFNAMAQIMSDNWRQIGVDLVLQPFENQVVTDLAFNQRDFDALIIGYTTAGDPAIGISRQYVSIEPGHAFTNPTNYSNPEVDRLFLEAASTPFLDERRALYYAVQEVIAEDLPVINVVDRTETDAAAAGLRGLWQSSQPYDLWGQVWWEGGGN